MSPSKAPSHTRTQKKWRLRRRQTVGSLLLSLHEHTGNFRQAAENAMNKRKKLHQAKEKLRQAVTLVQNLQNELIEMKTSCSAYSQEMITLVDQLTTPGVLEIEENQERNLGWNLTHAQIEIISNEKKINIIDHELNTYNFILPKPEPVSTPIRTPILSIPNIDITGSIQKNGTIKIDRSVKCCLCLRNSINCVLYRCGHACTCHSCATEVINNSKTKKCPICQMEIRRIIKTYTV